MAAVIAVGLMTLMTACSSAADPVEPGLWGQVDDAKRILYGIIHAPSTSVPSTPEALLEQLSTAAIHWDGEEVAPSIADDQGSLVFYNYQVDDNDDVTFDVLVASGIDADISTPGWLVSRPDRVYTCFRTEVSFRNGTLWDSRRSHDYGEDLLECPPVLVRALGDGAQYREPEVFNG